MKARLVLRHSDARLVRAALAGDLEAFEALVLNPGQEIRYTTHTYDDSPNYNSPSLTFSPTSEDEMSIMLG